MENTIDREVLSEDDEEWSSSESSDTHDEIEFEELESTIAVVDDDPDLEGPYAEEPLASAEWLEEYNKELRRIEERKQALQNRLDRVLAESTW